MYHEPRKIIFDEAWSQKTRLRDVVLLEWKNNLKEIINNRSLC